MKVTDIFTLFHRSNPPAPSAIKGGGVKPVAVIDKMSLQPGQLFRGEVLGEDGQGNLLLKIGGEIIATRGLVNMALGQQVWVEVKDVADSPLFALAEAKGAIHELLKNIMEVRPALLVQGESAAEVAPDFKFPLAPASELSFVPKLTPISDDGRLPRETTQLLKALLALAKLPVPPLSETKTLELRPFLSPETGKVDVGKVVTVLDQTGKIPPVLKELEPFRQLFIFADKNAPVSKGQVVASPMPLSGKSPVVFFVQPPMAPPPLSPAQLQGPQVLSHSPDVPPHGLAGKTAPVTVPFITEDGQVVGHAVAVVRSLVAAIPLVPGLVPVDKGGGEEQVSKGFSELVKSILTQGKIPETLRRTGPVQHLLQNPGAVKSTVALQPVTSDELIQSFAETSVVGKVLSPISHNETVVKVLSSLQGHEPRPEMLRVLKQLVSFVQTPLTDDKDGDVSGSTAKLHEAVAGLSKAASFFQSQALVNQEIAQATHGDCVLVPCFFAGQSGWGEWMWSHEHQEGNGESQENLAFFLEMSNLGPVAIQAILGEQTLSGQFQVAGDRAYSLIQQGLPMLEERLHGLGYEAHFTCRQKPVAVMQEIKDSLESRTCDLTPTSLVDIHA